MLVHERWRKYFWKNIKEKETCADYNGLQLLLKILRAIEF